MASLFSRRFSVLGTPDLVPFSGRVPSKCLRFDSLLFSPPLFPFGPLRTTESAVCYVRHVIIFFQHSTSSLFPCSVDGPPFPADAPPFFFFSSISPSPLPSTIGNERAVFLPSLPCSHTWMPNPGPFFPFLIPIITKSPYSTCLLFFGLSLFSILAS